MTTAPRILHVCSEVSPLAMTGGLGDVCAALPAAQADLGAHPIVIMPRYRRVDLARHGFARRLEPLAVNMGERREQVTIHEGRLPGGRVPIYLLEHPLFDRPGLYGGDDGPYPDNHVRFALLCRAALAFASRANLWPDVLHAHDWQGALALYLARHEAPAGRAAPATVLTIHNLAFQGNFPKSAVTELGLPWDVFRPDAAEFYDQLSFLKAGIVFADRITTVSSRYSREIQTTEFGFGLDGVLRAHAARLSGIVNGIDTLLWNPQHDPHLPVHFDAGDRSGKAACKAAVQRELGLGVRAQVPLLAMIARLADQKGFDLIAQAGEELVAAGTQLAFLCSPGEGRHQDALATLARRHPSKVALRIAYDDPLAHRLEAGADLFLMPSRYEPCGLNQLYSMRYGTLPVVHETGGLADTVVDYDERTRTGNGFRFSHYTSADLVHAVRRALGIYRDAPAFAALSARAMRQDFGWSLPARRYLEIYDRARAARAA